MSQAPGSGMPFNVPAAFGLNGVSSTMMPAVTSSNMKTAGSSGMIGAPKPATDGSKSKQNFDKILAALSGYFPDMRRYELLIKLFYSQYHVGTQNTFVFRDVYLH